MNPASAAGHPRPKRQKARARATAYPMRGLVIPTKAALALAESEALGNVDPVHPRSESAGAVVDEHDAFGVEDGRQAGSTNGAPLRSRR